MTQLRSWAARVRDRLQSRAADPVWGPLGSFVPQRPGGRLGTVVVCVDSADDPAVEEFLDVPADLVMVVAPYPRRTWPDHPHVEHRKADDLVEANWLLRFRRDIDVVVDLGARTGEEYDEWWHRLFLHVRDGGIYVVDRRGARDDVLPARLTAYAETIGTPPKEMIEAGITDRPRRRAMASLHVDDERLVVGVKGVMVLKTKDSLADRILAEREPELDVELMATLPEGQFTSRAHVVSHEASRPMLFLETELSHPALHLRRYRGQIAMAPNALLRVGTTALPDSFRHHANRNPTNPRLVDASGDFGRPLRKDAPVRTLEGSYYHLDSENPGHFGHLMTEVISRLWGWEQAKAADPDLKAIFRTRLEGDPTDLEQRVLGAYGIDPADMVWVHEPVWLESVVAATPMWHNSPPHHVHPRLLETWDRLRDALLAETVAPTEGFERSGGTRLFVSRRDVTGNRSCRNTREVEAFFAERGYDVLYPEDHDLAAQAAIFDRAEVLAGFGGSAMFNVLFSRDHRAMVLVNHEGYTARNEHLYAALLGGDLHYFWSTPDIEHPREWWSRDAYYSPWEFDFDRNAGPLDEVLRSY